jgi:hypothetical protein
MEAQSSTINIRGQRKVVAIEYHKEFAFKIPDGIDMEDKNVVQHYFVKWDKLHIVYTDKDKQPDIIEVDWKTYDDELNIPNDMRIADADEYGLEYSEDDEEEIQPTTYQCDICNHHLEDWEKGTCNDCFYDGEDKCNTCNNILEPNCKCNTKCDICNNYLNCECPK